MAGEGGGGTNLAFGVVLTVVIVTAACVSTNLVTNTQLIKSGFHFPFTLMWFGGSTKILLGVPKLVSLLRRRRVLEAVPRPWLDDLISTRAVDSLAMVDGVTVHKRGSVKDELMCFLILFVIYVMANASQLVAVSTVSAGIVSAIFSTSSAFVCVLSRVMLKRPFQAIEVIAITCSISGMLLVARPWHHASADGKAIGAAVLAPIAAALHTTYVTRKFTGCGGVEVGWILCKLSMLLLVLGGIGVAVLVAAGAEHPVWEHHMTLKQKILLPACAITGWLFNGSTSYAATVTYPLFVTVGMVLSTIFTVVASGIINGDWPALMQIGGMVLIGIGFGLLASNDWRKRKQQADEVRHLLAANEESEATTTPTP